MKREEIDKLLADFEPHHSDFQIEYFMIKGQGHPWFQYKQCLREIKGRIDTLDEIKVKYRITEDKVKRLKDSNADQPRIDAVSRRLGGMLDRMISVETELEMILKLAKRLRSQYHFINIDIEKRQSLESNAWFDKAKRMIVMDLIASNGLGVSRQTLEFCFSFPSMQRHQLLKWIRNEEDRPVLIDQITKEGDE